MALVLADRVNETTTTAGTGTVTLAGAVNGYQSFSAIGNGNTTYYTISHQTANEWEVGIGTYTSSGTTLSRDTVLASSNSGSLVNFSAGTKNVFADYPAGKAIYKDASGNSIALGTPASVTLTNATGLPLSTGVTGTLPIASGGTNTTTTPTAGAVAYGTGSAYAFTAAGTSNQVLISNGASAPSWSNLSSLGVSSFSAGTTGFTPSTATTGAVTLAGTLATTNGGTGLTSFTANGVLYASSSSALTTGSTLTFDGTTFQYALSLPVQKIIGSGSGDFGIKILTGTPGSTADIGGLTYNSSTGEQRLHGDQSYVFQTFYAGGSEQMRLTSTGLGIGTSSPQAKLQVLNTIKVSSADQSSGNVILGDGGSTAFNVGIARWNGSTNAAGAGGMGYFAQGSVNAGGHYFYTGDAAAGSTTLRMTLDSSGNLGIGTSSPGAKLQIVGGTRFGPSSDYIQLNQVNTNMYAWLCGALGDYSLYMDTLRGNLGLGVTPSAWYSGSKNFDFSYGAVSSDSTAASLTFNSFYQTVGGWTYKNTAAAARYKQAGASHEWYSAPSGTAGTAISFTQAMTLNASGNLGIGTTSPAKLLDVNGDALINGLTVGRGSGNVSTNTAVGVSALTTNSTGSQDVAVGLNALYFNTTGSYNNAVGVAAMQSNTTGAYNTAFGNAALFSNTTASQNTAMGYVAGYSNTTGANQVAIGAQALYTNTTGTQNTAVGWGGLYYNSTGNYNTAQGYQALYNNTTASNNTAVGYQAGYSNTTGGTSTFIGRQAGYSSTGGSNTLIGDQAGYFITSGTNNVGVGRYVLNASGGTNTGSYNVGLGDLALANNTTASYNTAVGYQAGYSNTTGGQNVALGYQALFSNTTGQLNVAIGMQALLNQNADAYNTAVGANSMQNTTSGGQNAAFGRLSLYNNTTGSYNTALGYQSLQANTTASGNTAIGYQSLISNTTSANNTAVGYLSGANNTSGNITAFGSSAGNNNTTGVNTAIGLSALYANTTGDKNTAVGTYTAYNGNGSNNTTVGYYAAYSVGNANGITAIGSQAMYIGGGTPSNSTAVGTAALYQVNGVSNTAVGYYAALSTTSGAYNVAIGDSALYSNTTANYNTAVGFQSLYSNTTASQNTAVGYLAGRNTTTGSGNAFFGFEAGYAATGINNVAIGSLAGVSGTLAGNYNTLVGFYAGSVTTGQDNTFIGASSGNSNTSGNFNTAVGKESLQNNTTASNNTAVGFQAGYSNVTGFENAFFGVEAGKNSTGNFNTFLGAYASRLNTSGAYNTAVGDSALYSNTTASFNTAVGYQALYSQAGAGDRLVAIGYHALYSYNSANSINTAVGYYAGRSLTTGNANVLIGGYAGYSLTTGANNVFVGGNTSDGAGYYVTTGSKNTIIGGYNGNQGGLDIRTASNYIVLSDGDGNPRQVINSSGALGLNGANYGTSGQVLTSNGSGSAPTWQAAGGGALVNLGTGTWSGTTAVTVTSGISSSYKFYRLVLSNVYSGSASNPANIKFYAGGSVDSNSCYIYQNESVANGTTANTNNNAATFFALFNYPVYLGSAQSEQGMAIIDFTYNSSNYTINAWASITTPGGVLGIRTAGATYLGASGNNAAVTGFYFYSTVNFQGTWTLYGWN